MSDKSNDMLFVLVGLAIGAFAVYLYLTQTNKTTVTEFVRDAEGHIISIVEKKL